MKKLVEHARNQRIVLFAGAGISMAAPTALPGWKEVNETILAALARRLVVFTGKPFADDIMAKLVATREHAGYFTPDYQAQLIEDECGPDYFRVLQALDAEEPNGCHDTIAALAARGHIAAIITTNFDRCLERACAAANVTPRIFYDHTHWSDLQAALAPGNGQPLPIIKVHGSVNDPNSMVDTLRQRLAGRPQALEDSIRDLLARHHVLFVGFSGGDLYYDEGYLGLKAAAANHGFTCLVETGKEPSKSMAMLQKSWGEGAHFLEGRLPEWLSSFAAELEISSAPTTPITVAPNRLAAVTAHADAWAESLGHMLCVAIMAELLGSSNREPLAFELLTKTYRWFIPERDMEAPGYARFNYQIGHRMLERGAFDNRVDPMREREVRRDHISRYTGNDCFQCLHRAVCHSIPQAEIDLGLYDALMGKPLDGDERIWATRESARQKKNASVFADAGRTLAIIAEIFMNYDRGLELLEPAYQATRYIGDEPRRARVCAEQVRFLAKAHRFSEAHQKLAEGYAIADRLGLEIVRLELRSAEGCLRVEEQKPAEALVTLEQAVTGFRQADRCPALTRALLDVCYAAYMTRNDLRLHATQDEIESLLATYPGYEPAYGYAMLRLRLSSGRLDSAREIIPEVKRVANRYQNPGVILAIEELERQAGLTKS
jgi:SIR2-like domain